MFFNLRLCSFTLGHVLYHSCSFFTLPGRTEEEFTVCSTPISSPGVDVGSVPTKPINYITNQVTTQETRRGLEWMTMQYAPVYRRWEILTCDTPVYHKWEWEIPRDIPGYHRWERDTKRYSSVSQVIEKYQELDTPVYHRWEREIPRDTPMYCRWERHIDTWLLYRTWQRLFGGPVDVAWPQKSQP